MQFRAKKTGQKHSGLGSVSLYFFLPLWSCGVTTTGPGFSSFYLLQGSAGRPGCWLRRSEHLLRGVGDVEEAVCVTVAGINLPHAGRHAGHALFRYQEEQGLGGVQVNLVPEQAQELTQGELERNQELCFVQQGESLFTDVTFNNHRQFVWEFRADAAHFIFSCFEAFPLLEGHHLHGFLKRSHACLLLGAVCRDQR